MKHLMSLLMLLFARTLLAHAADDGVSPLPPLAPAVVGEPTRIEVHPNAVVLNSARRQMQLVVTGYYADGSSGSHASGGDRYRRSQSGLRSRIHSLPCWRRQDDSDDSGGSPANGGDGGSQRSGQSRSGFLSLWGDPGIDEARLQCWVLSWVAERQGEFLVIYARL